MKKEDLLMVSFLVSFVLSFSFVMFLNLPLYTILPLNIIPAALSAYMIFNLLKTVKKTSGYLSRLFKHIGWSISLLLLYFVLQIYLLLVGVYSIKLLPFEKFLYFNLFLISLGIISLYYYMIMKFVSLAKEFGKTFGFKLEVSKDGKKIFAKSH